MKISTRGRYALAAMVVMAQRYETGQTTTVISISDGLGLSRIYLEQVFSLLKRGGIVTSAKGAQGGYLLSRPPRQITVRSVLYAVEASLFERTEDTVSSQAPEVESALRVAVWDPLDSTVTGALEQTTLQGLLEQAQHFRAGQGLLFFI